MLDKKKIKIFGASNCGNVGDDLIALILKKYVENFFEDQAEVSLIPQQKQFEQIKDADILIIGGGGLIYDYDINNVKNYCEAVRYAHDYRIPIYFMGMGVQHVFSEEAKNIYKAELPKVSAIATRGTFDSQFIIETLNYDPARVITSRDLVFLYDDVLQKREAESSKGKKPVLSLSLADWKLGTSYKNIQEGLEEAYDNYRTYLERTLPTLKDHFDVRVICQANEDREISEYLAGIFETEVVTFPDVESSAELVEVYRASNFVITNRYHGLIAAIIAKTPALGVSFSTHKSQRLIRDSFPSLEEQFYTVDDFVKKDILTQLTDKTFTETLKTAEVGEYDLCLAAARRHSDVLKFIATDIAKGV